MADAKSQPEPSMEEILASIRRIISEDEQEPGAAPSGKTAVAPPAGEPAKPAAASPARPAPSAARAPAPAPEPEGDAVLDLTERVSDDGTVVNLRAASDANARGPRAEPAGPSAPMPPATPVGEIELRDNIPTGGTEAPPPSPRPSPAAAASDLLSAEAAQLATASLAVLARAVDRESTGEAIGVGGRTLEDLVKEIMRPMIRDWLDANLPALVERLVRREIERISHRAQE